MHTVHGLIRKAPFIKQLENSTMFVVELSEMVKDFKTGEKSYTNYKAMLFAKSQGAVDYYTNATQEGAFVVISSEKLKVEQREYNGKTYITLMMDNARLEGGHFQSQSNYKPITQEEVMPQSQQWQNQDFDPSDDIPF